jgi:hypothetical protein
VAGGLQHLEWLDLGATYSDGSGSMCLSDVSRSVWASHSSLPYLQPLEEHQWKLLGQTIVQLPSLWYQRSSALTTKLSPKRAECLRRPTVSWFTSSVAKVPLLDTANLFLANLVFVSKIEQAAESSASFKFILVSIQLDRTHPTTERLQVQSLPMKSVVTFEHRAESSACFQTTNEVIGLSSGMASYLNETD